MGQHANHNRPNIPLPAGFAEVDDWQPDERLPCRVIFGADRGTTGHKVCVSTAAIQWGDGSVDDGYIEAPNIEIDAWTA